MIENAPIIADPPCPRCRASASGAAAPLSERRRRRAAERLALAELGPPPDAHLFNYAVAFFAFVFICVAIPGNARDFLRAFVLELSLVLLALGVNRTLLRSHAQRIDEHRARLRARAELLATGGAACPLPGACLRSGARD